MSATQNAPIAWLSHVKQSDLRQVGGKAVNLSILSRAGLNVPNCFVISSTCFSDFLTETGIVRKIDQLIETLDTSNSEDLKTVSDSCQKLILSASLSPDLALEIKTAYKKLTKNSSSPVAVRSSATNEDSNGSSFAGQQDSYMNVKGIANVMTAIRMTWASMFEERALYYREQKGFPLMDTGLAVVVQEMVTSQSAGVMFTADPISSNRDVISIEAAYGLGLAVVSGSLTPDQYFVNKSNLELLDKKIVEQNRMLASAATRPAKSTPYKDNDKLFWISVPTAYAKKAKLTDREIQELSQMGKEIEYIYQQPQDIEWVFSGKKIYIVQTRPVTTLTPTKQPKGEDVVSPLESNPILDGLGASIGIASGKVKIIKDAAELDRINDGDVLVTRQISPDFTPAMRKAVAVITDLGGRTSHAAIISRELKIPAIVGCDIATKTLSEGEIVTVDGKLGRVYEGSITNRSKKNSVSTSLPEQDQVSFDASQLITTATKIYCSVANPNSAESVVSRRPDGVGRLHGDQILKSYGVHPRYAIDQQRSDDFSDYFFETINQVSSQFEKLPVIYKLSDATANQYRKLEGGKVYETIELNPHIGLRGASRLLHDLAVFSLELEALKKVRRHHQNLWVLVPFVRTPDELAEIKKIMANIGLYRSGTFKLYLSLDVPANIFQIEKFIGIGIDGVSLNLDHLVSNLLSADPSNSILSRYFETENDAVIDVVRTVIKQCSKHGVKSDVFGSRIGTNSKLIDQLISLGTSSITVQTDCIHESRRYVIDAEFKKLKGLSVV